MTAVIDQLSDLFRVAETSDYVGESITQASHGLQAAALASKSGDDELTLAALLHDVGHLCDAKAERMANVGVLNHEIIGADFLSDLGFSPRVCELVEGHVQAKRYLVATQNNYSLSAASEKTLSFQGGPMDAKEVANFEADPHFSDLLRLRAWDEAAKKIDADVPAFNDYTGFIESHLEKNQLSTDQLAAFNSQGYLHLKNALSARHVERLTAAVDDLERRPETPGKWMKYFESSERLLCRVENFVQYCDPLAQLMVGPAMLTRISQLLGDEAVLFKEKINFKLPGGAGFEPHQDAPAFTTFGHKYHLTAMVSFDASTKENGCLQVVEGSWENEYLPMEADLTIRRDVSAQLNFTDVETKPGDIVIFGSYIPHRSGPNLSDQPRRALYATYNAKANGNVRDQYFAEKRNVFPPDVERDPNKEYKDTGIFNVGNPVQTEGLNN